MATPEMFMGCGWKSGVEVTFGQNLGIKPPVREHGGGTPFAKCLTKTPFTLSIPLQTLTSPLPTGELLVGGRRAPMQGVVSSICLRLLTHASALRYRT